MELHCVFFCFRLPCVLTGEFKPFQVITGKEGLTSVVLLFSVCLIGLHPSFPPLLASFVFFFFVVKHLYSFSFLGGYILSLFSPIYIFCSSFQLLYIFVPSIKFPFVTLYSCFMLFFFFLTFSALFLLYNIVLVLPYINMNPPWVYMCSPS